MSALLAFLRIAWPYLLTAGAGGFISHEIDQIPYARLGAQYSAYQVKVAQEEQARAQAAQEALQAQITARLTTEANNGQIIAKLTQERDSAALDRDLATRLLAAAQAKPRSPNVPQAPGGQPTAPASAADGGRSLTQELAAAIDECRHNSDQLDALIAEIRPQL